MDGSLKNQPPGRGDDAKVDLEFLACQMNALAGLKDDVMVLTAPVERPDATVPSLLVELRAMHKAA